MNFQRLFEKKHIEYGDFLAGVGRVTDAEFEVIEPTKTEQQDGPEQIAGSPDFNLRSIHEIFNAYCGTDEG